MTREADSAPRPQRRPRPEPAVGSAAGSGSDPRAADEASDDDAGTGTAYHVRVEGFEGPFDLLLQLIARRKLDVSEVDLAEITGEFLAHLRVDEDGMLDVDLDTATHFLVVAATLMEMKAARLLPEPEREQFEDLLAEARDVLYARLLEYKAFRDASAVIAERLEANASYVPRDAGLEERFEELVPDTNLPTDARGLASLAAAALAPRPEPHVSVAHLHVAALTVRDAARRVLGRIRDPGERAAFRALVDGLTRAERVVHFLALLELYKLGHVDLEQEERFGRLEVRRLDRAEDLDPHDERGAREMGDSPVASASPAGPA